MFYCRGPRLENLTKDEPFGLFGLLVRDKEKTFNKH
jgi:hypothetical protein